MEWRLKIKLVAMINEAKTYEDRKELRSFVLSKMPEFDIQSFGIVVRAYDISTENLFEDYDFAKKIVNRLKCISHNKFSRLEKQKINSLFKNFQELKPLS